jgi:hypothetical protein
MASEFNDHQRRIRRIMRQRERERDEDRLRSLERIEKDYGDIEPGEGGDGRIVYKKIKDQGDWDDE